MNKYKKVGWAVVYKGDLLWAAHVHKEKATETARSMSCKHPQYAPFRTVELFVKVEEPK
jgi:hypothetical protein